MGGDGGRKAAQRGPQRFWAGIAAASLVLGAATLREGRSSGDPSEIRKAVNRFAVSNRLATHQHLSLEASTDRHAGGRLPLVRAGAAADAYEVSVSLELEPASRYKAGDYLLRIESRTPQRSRMERVFRQGLSPGYSTERVRIDPRVFGDSLILRLVHRSSGRLLYRLEADLADHEPDEHRPKGPGSVEFESHRPRLVIPLGVAQTGKSRATLHFDLTESPAFGPEGLRICASPDWNVAAGEDGSLCRVEGAWRTTVLRLSRHAFRIDTAGRDGALLRSVELCQVSKSELWIREEDWSGGKRFSTRRTCYRKEASQDWLLCERYLH